MVRWKIDAPQKQGLWAAASLENGISEIRHNSMGIRKASRTFGVPKSTLQRRVIGSVVETAPASRPTIFTRDVDTQLAGQILDMEARGFGLSVQDVCKLSYDMADQLKVKHSFTIEKRKAGYDWYCGFMKRHPHIALRKPEGLSALRATMLNKNVVSGYFTLLTNTLEKLKLTDKGAFIYNVDETGMNTVHQPPKILGLKGKKSIHVKTSADRGENITAVVCMNASGHYIPPMIIVMGQRLNKGLLSNAPTDTLFATSKSSFIDTDLFHHWFADHFLKHIPTTRPVLLILDGHASLISLPTLLLAKERNVELLCLPPHTTSELQPLDKCLFKPLKTEYNRTCMTFMKENPGQVITRYDFCGLFRKAYYTVCTMANAESAFRATGICPINPDILPDEVYAPSSISVLEVPATPAVEQQVERDSTLPPIQTEQSNVETPSTSRTCIETEPPTAGITLTLKDILSVPTVIKSATEISNKKSRRVTSARCLTECEFLQQLAEKERTQEEKRLEKENRQKERELKAASKQHKKSIPSKTTNRANVKGKQPKQKENIKPVSDPENYCQTCNGYYFDDSSDDEDWVKCTFEGCGAWFHESCTGVLGTVSQFRCNRH